MVTVLDQAACSLTSFVVLLYALRSLPLVEVGAFSLIFGGYVVALGVVRSLCVEVLLSRYVLADPAARLAAARAAVGAAVLVGFVLALVCSVLWSVADRHTSERTILLVSLLMVPILVQDAGRFYWVGSARPGGALVNDLTCLLATAAAAVACGLRAISGVTAVLGCWALGAGLAAVLASVQLRALPDVRRGTRWIWEHRAVGLPLAGSTLLAQGAVRISLVVTAAIAGLAEVGRLGASMAVLAPTNVLITACYLYGTAECARRVNADPDQLGRLILWISLGLLGCLLGVGALYLALPDQVGVSLLGPNWLAAQACLVPVLVWFLAGALLQGPQYGLRALGGDRRIFRLFGLLGLAQVTGATIGAALGGGTGAAWGIAAASLLSLPCWCRAYLGAWHRGSPDRTYRLVSP